MHSVPSPVLFPVLVLALLSSLAAPRALYAQGAPDAADERPLPAVGERTQGLQRRDGLLRLWLDEDRGRALLELEQRRFGEELLLTETLAGGLGSNPVGLDRGMTGPTRLVRFERRGRKAFLVERNLRFRASSADAAAARAIDESFASSTLAALPIVAAADGRFLLDATPLLVRDALGIARTLEASGEGTYELDRERSAVHLEACAAFPRNLELEAELGFTAKAKPGAEAAKVAPEATQLALRQRLSFLALPDAGFSPRAYDPRAGSFAIEFHDHTQPLDAPLVQRWIVRHRLEKRDRTAARSAVVQPIVYYVDRAAPPEVRAALMEGARWWNRAFEAAGFLDAFRVEPMPDDMDPVDARHHVILWVHRATRGWSYGSTVVDPRTGEILRGVVRLGSQRMRQDVLLARGLLGAAAEERGASGASRAAELALARLRQLSAHEVGHTLGFVHHFGGSAQGRASVMDYPAPKIALRADSSIDLSDAYANDLGAWDLHAVAFAYRDFGPDADEASALEELAVEARKRGLRLLSESDARGEHTMHPSASLWDNAEDGLAELRNAVAVRNVALARFTSEALPKGRPATELEEILLPLYLHHRYALEAAAKLIGGIDYAHALRGDGTPLPRAVSAGLQRGALQQMLAMLRADFLRLPAGLAAQLPPRPAELEAFGERFPSRTAPAFDALAPAELSIARTLELLLHPARLARVLDQQAADPAQMTLHEIFEHLDDAILPRAAEFEHEGDQQLVRLVQHLYLERCIALALDATARHEVRAAAERAIRNMPSAMQGPDVGWANHEAWMRTAIQRFLERRGEVPLSEPRARLPLPPGAPIGCGCGEH
ncbi:MAG: zinc-dependent metalloprotease [Planctomycetes bacterium]|nr:zinc-dependent metalloprotease [Planctomycetota bacterium]